MIGAVGDLLKRKGVALEGIPSERPGRLDSPDTGVDSGPLAATLAINEAAPEEWDSSGAKPTL